jgi:hypothetical protein
MINERQGMSHDQPHLPTPRLWNGALGLMTMTLAGALALIVALALGWNSPRPTRPPDWQAPGLPVQLKAPRSITEESEAAPPFIMKGSEAAPSGEVKAVLSGHPMSDFTLEMEALPLSGPNFNGYGLIYRAQDTTYYAAFAIGSDGYYGILRATGSEVTMLVDWQQFPHIRRGQQTNRLRVACEGATCHFYINDEYATSVEDSTWARGDAGLWMRGFGDEDVIVQFLYLYAWE